MILLSTDTEITEEARDRLAPHIGRSYRLDFDRATADTTVRPGYFQTLEPCLPGGTASSLPRGASW